MIKIICLLDLCLSQAKQVVNVALCVKLPR